MDIQSRLIGSVSLLTVMVLGCIGCTLTRGSSVVLGPVHPRFDPALVKLYDAPPKKYERIAYVSSDSRNAFATQQNLTNNAILRLKKEAAKVGANGILFEGIGNSQVGATGVAFVSPGSPMVMGASSSQTGRETKGIAIFVTEE